MIKAIFRFLERLIGVLSFSETLDEIKLKIELDDVKVNHLRLQKEFASLVNDHNTLKKLYYDLLESTKVEKKEEVVFIDQTAVNVEQETKEDTILPDWVNTNNDHSYSGHTFNGGSNGSTD